jgi:hypothetical protein
MDNTKLCRGCGQHKPLDEYSRNIRMADGYQSKCKVCLRAHACRYYKATEARRLAKLPKKWVVYTLSGPDGVVFYVGSGRPSRPRLMFRNYRSDGTAALKRKFEEIAQAGGQPSFEVVSEHDTVEEARAAEGVLIRSLVGSGQLVNQVLCPVLGNLSLMRSG